MGLPSPFVFYALVDIVIRFFDTALPVLIRSSVRSNQSFLLKMEYHHHHSGSLFQYSIVFLYYFLEVRVFEADRFLSDRGTTGKVQLLPSLFPD